MEQPSPVFVEFQSPNAVQLQRVSVSARSWLIGTAGRALPYVVVVVLALGMSAIAARQGLSLRGSLCLFLAVAPFVYLMGKLGGLILKMLGLFGQVRAGAHQPFHEVRSGVGPTVRVQISNVLEVQVRGEAHSFEWSLVSLVFAKQVTVFAIEGSRFVGVPDDAFTTPAERDSFIGAARAHVSTFVDLRDTQNELRKLYDKDE